MKKDGLQHQTACSETIGIDAGSLDTVRNLVRNSDNAHTPGSKLRHRRAESTPNHRQGRANPQTTPSNQSAGHNGAAMTSILPRVNGYKRVDSDDGPNGGRIRFGWKKFAVGAVVVIALVALFGPRERRDSVIDSVTPPSWRRPTRPDKDYGDSLITTTSHQLSPPTPTSSSSKPANAPHSFEEDPDPSKTVFCSAPHDPSAHIVQYALMIDAGSTGSRIHIYKFNNCKKSPEYEYEVFKQTKPGLSSFAGNPGAAAESLDVLLDKAVEVVPEDLWRCTPVAVKATAGLRLLGARESDAILDKVRERLESKYPFSVVSREKEGVVIMDGKDEGVYAWITANYLLGAIGDSNGVAAARSYAVLDLGGASTQIVFEPDFGVDSEPDSAFTEGEHKYELQFGGKSYMLYQHSYLGYGLMRARESVHRLVEFMSTFNRIPGADSASEGAPIMSFMEEIANPCLATGTRRTVTIKGVLPGELDRNVTMTGSDVGSFEGCNRIVELVMAKDAICQAKPCAFNGVYQPSILQTFSEAKGNILLLSYFYDRIAPFFPELNTEQPLLTINSIGEFARDICQGPKRWKARWGGHESLMEELEDRPEWCLDMTFMHGLLRLGYEFSSERSVRIEKQVDGTELGWCLGATIAIVGGDLTCRV